MSSTEWGPAFYYYMDSDGIWFVVCSSQFVFVLYNSSSNAYNYGSVEFAPKFSLLQFDQLDFFRIF
jgi:hypothetical protein